MCFSILHIPHSSQTIPSSVRPSLLLTDEQVRLELFKLTDHYTDELFDPGGKRVKRIVFPVSRLVLDPERFLDDDLETMSRKGMGVVYTRTSDGETLRADNHTPTKSELVEEYYVPHHMTLNQATEESLEKHGSCLVLDCHSFPSSRLPYEQDLGKPRPEICLGVNSAHTPDWLYEEAERLFTGHGFHVDRDNPFGGTLVPSEFYKKRTLVQQQNKQSSN